MLIRDRHFDFGSKTYIMGILNLSLDSFSGDGLGNNIELVIQTAIQMEESGADIIDIGAESTRRSNNQVQSVQIDYKEEINALVPVIRALTSAISIPLSVDTYKPLVAQHCLEAGVNVINNIWGTRCDPDMFKLVSSWDVPIIIMHNNYSNRYHNLISEIYSSLKYSINFALSCDVNIRNIILDPGLGFGKIVNQNLDIERKLDVLKNLGCPLLIGPSRKSHIGIVLGDLPVTQRFEGTAGIVSTSIAQKVDIVRVHDVKEISRVSRMVDLLTRNKSK